MKSVKLDVFTYKALIFVSNIINFFIQKIVVFGLVSISHIPTKFLDFSDISDIGNVENLGIPTWKSGNSDKIPIFPIKFRYFPDLRVLVTILYVSTVSGISRVNSKVLIDMGNFSTVKKSSFLQLLDNFEEEKLGAWRCFMGACFQFFPKWLQFF